MFVYLPVAGDLHTFAPDRPYLVATTLPDEFELQVGRLGDDPEASHQVMPLHRRVTVIACRSEARPLVLACDLPARQLWIMRPL